MNQVELIAIDSIEITNVDDINVYNLELESDSLNDDLYWIDATSMLITHNCLPKDLKSLISQAQSAGYEPELLKEVDASNVRIGELRKKTNENKMEDSNSLESTTLYDCTSVETGVVRQKLMTRKDLVDSCEWEKIAFDPIDETLRKQVVEQFKVETVRLES